MLYTTELLRHVNDTDILIYNEVILSNFHETVKTVGNKLIFIGNFKFPLYRDCGIDYNKLDYVIFPK